LTFKYLQEKLGLSEDELEQYFTESHLGKAKLKSREGLELNTLQEVVSALGGTLEITIKIPQKEPFVLIGE
jgi:glucose-6-phosphate-specific signal transduction histidine kinase